MNTTYLILYSANFAFILTNLYGWLLKWFYRPKAYGEHFRELFPAQRSVGALYLMQLFELPYLLHIGDADALLYVNAFSVLIFSLQMLVMCEGYFFPEVHRKPCDYWVFLPAVVIILPLFLQAVGLIRLPEWHTAATFVLVGAVFAWYFWRTIRMAQRIGQAVRRVNEATYADSDDFPTRFGQKIQWLPTAICVLMAVNFFLNDPTVKAVRDVLFTFVNIWFCIYTLNPWRKPFDIQTQQTVEAIPDTPGGDASATVDAVPADDDATFRLSDDRYEALSRRLERLLTDDRIFTEQHITADMLTQRLGINANYLTELIQRSGYLSFYDMISQHRVRHAISLITQHPDRRLADIAADCGFTSQSSMTKAFASQGKESPSAYRKRV